MPESRVVPSASCTISNPSRYSCQDGSRCPLMRIDTYMSGLVICKLCAVLYRGSIVWTRGTNITCLHDRTGDWCLTIGELSAYPIPQETPPALMPLLELEKVQPQSHRDGFGAAAHAQFAINTADLGLDRIGGDNQFLGHLGVRPSGNEQP